MIFANGWEEYHPFAFLYYEVREKVIKDGEGKQTSLII